jgi:hypothetical protein
MLSDFMETFESEVRRSIEYGLREKPHLRAYKRYLKGVSENYWEVDIVIEDTTQKSDEARIKAIINCKGPGYESGAKPQPHTYREHMLRAYAQLADLRSYTTPKYLVVTYKEEAKSELKTDYESLFKSIGVEIIDYSNPVELLKLYHVV